MKSFLTVLELFRYAFIVSLACVKSTTMSLNKLLFKSAMRAAVLSPSSVRALTPFLVRHGSHRSPTEHPESTFGKDSFQSGISHKHTDPPHTDMTNAGAGRNIACSPFSLL